MDMRVARPKAGSEETKEKEKKYKFLQENVYEASYVGS